MYIYICSQSFTSGDIIGKFLLLGLLESRLGLVWISSSRATSYWLGCSSKDQSETAPKESAPQEAELSWSMTAPKKAAPKEAEAAPEEASSTEAEPSSYPGDCSWGGCSKRGKSCTQKDAQKEAKRRPRLCGPISQLETAPNEAALKEAEAAPNEA